MNYSKSWWIGMGIGLALLMGADLLTGEEPTSSMKEFKLELDRIPEGRLPSGWKIDATNAKELAEWEVIADPNAPAGRRILAITKIHDASENAFNLFWTRAIVFRDGVINVKIRADKGEMDQGGGVIWRVRDDNNYYLARFNPLEENFRIYFVKDGRRRLLAGADGMDIKTGEWFELKITYKGNKIEGFLNGRKKLELRDGLFLDGGGVGFWTKADATSSFQDFTVSSK